MSPTKKKVPVLPVVPPPQTDVDIFVCKTCRRADTPDQAAHPGAKLLASLNTADLPAGVRVYGVDCLSNCTNGCTIVLQSTARWAYICGNIKPESDLEQLCQGIAGYSHIEDGIVPWKQRVALFTKNSVARIPSKTRTD